MAIKWTTDMAEDCTCKEGYDCPQCELAKAMYEDDNINRMLDNSGGLPNGRCDY